MADNRITIDGKDHAVRDYPEEFVELLARVYDDAETELHEMQRTPEQCPQNIFSEWHHGDIAFVNHRAVLPRLLGRAYELGIGEDPLGGLFTAGFANDRFEDDETIRRRLDWIETNANSGHTIWWQRQDTGDGILLDTYAYVVVFHDPADDARFIAAFPGAGA